MKVVIHLTIVFMLTADSESSPIEDRNQKSASPEDTWSIVEETNVKALLHSKDVQSSTKLHTNALEDTPVKSKCKSLVLPHEISKIRTQILSPMNMSLDNSIDNDNPLSLEHKKIDFNNVDLKFLTDNASHFEFTANATKVDSNSSFKRVDSGFNENTFYANASSYYESAIKPSELTVTNVSKLNTSKTALKEISNIPWMRIDSGFKDETSADSMQFYCADENPLKTDYRFSETCLKHKENVATENFDRFLVQSASKNETMSMSDIFADDMTFNCNFSSTPSKNKTRKGV